MGPMVESRGWRERESEGSRRFRPVAVGVVRRGEDWRLMRGVQVREPRSSHVSVCLGASGLRMEEETRERERFQMRCFCLAAGVSPQYVFFWGLLGFFVCPA